MGAMISQETSYLFATPSFLGGMAHTLDLGGTLEMYNESSSPAKADAKAIRNDWKAVGQDIFSSMQQFSNEQ